MQVYAAPCRSMQYLQEYVRPCRSLRAHTIHNDPIKRGVPRCFHRGDYYEKSKVRLAHIIYYIYNSAFLLELS